MTVFSRGHGDSGGRLAFEVDAGGDALVVMAGRLVSGDVDEVGGRIRALLRDADCVLVDVNDLTFDRPALLDVFSAALMGAGGWPAAKLAVFSRNLAMRSALAGTGVDRLVVVDETAEGARTRCDGRPKEVRAEWGLAADRSAPRAAREYAHQRLLLWGCPERTVANTVQVVSELVSNAVEHAHTPLQVTLTLDESTLLCAVRDRSHARPTRPARPAVDIAGWGMRIVEALSRSWGWTDHADGKTVWAVVDPSS